MFNFVRSGTCESVRCFPDNGYFCICPAEKRVMVDVFQHCHSCLLFEPCNCWLTTMHFAALRHHAPTGILPLCSYCLLHSVQPMIKEQEKSRKMYGGNLWCQVLEHLDQKLGLSMDQASLLTWKGTLLLLLGFQPLCSRKDKNGREFNFFLVFLQRDLLVLDGEFLPVMLLTMNNSGIFAATLINSV